MNKTIAAVVIMATTVVLAGCSATPAKPAHTAPTTGTVKGTITVYSSALRGSSQGVQPCRLLSASGLSEIQQGAEVDAVDLSGKVLAFGHLGYGTMPGKPLDPSFGLSCRFPFTIKHVPHGKRVYGLQFFGLGTLHYTEKPFFGHTIPVTIGGTDPGGNV